MTINKNLGAILGLLALAGLAVVSVAAVKTRDGKPFSKTPDRKVILEKCDSLVSRLERENQRRAA